MTTLAQAARQGRAIKSVPRPAGEVAFHPAGDYTRQDARQMVSELRHGIPEAGQDVDELGVGLCGLLAGGRFPSCQADRCYSSRHAMAAKAFSVNAHGQEATQPNPFPPGSTGFMTDAYAGDGERITQQIGQAVAVGEAARQQFEHQEATATLSDANYALAAELGALRVGALDEEPQG